jgi:hypothetical protein
VSPGGRAAAAAERRRYARQGYLVDRGVVRMAAGVCRLPGARALRV